MPDTAVFLQSVKSSARLAVVLLSIHVLAAAAVYLTALAPALRLALWSLILLSLGYFLARDALLLLPNSWRYLAFEQDNVTVKVRDGSSFSGEITGETFVSPHFIVLRIGLKDRRLPVSRIIFPDAMGPDAFRELCVRLRFTSPGRAKESSVAGAPASPDSPC